MLKPISKQTLSQTILDGMIGAIKDGVWQPGSRIPGEQELASLFAVSRNSIRESVKILNSMGILYSRAGQGTFLSSDAIQQIVYLDFLEKGKGEDNSILDLVETRILLESQCTYWTARRATEADRCELRAILDKCRNLDPGDLDAQDRLHMRFHDAIVEMSKNGFVIRLFSLIEAEIELQRSKYMAMPADIQVDMIRDQEVVLTHILNHEPNEARRAMEKHLQKGLKLLAEVCGDKDKTIEPA